MVPQDIVHVINCMDVSFPVSVSMSVNIYNNSRQAIKAFIINMAGICGDI